MFPQSLKRSLILAIFTLNSVSFAFSEGTDELWEITTKMDMGGMPMAMPAQTTQTCLPKNRKSDEALVPKDKNSDCKMDSMQQSGAKSTFKMTCTGKNPISGTGEFENHGDNYNGNMHMVGNMEGQSFDMTQTFSGKRIGTCTYEDQGKKFAAMQEKMTAQMCRDSIDRLEWRVYADTTGQFDVCKPYKKDFCARVNKTAGDLHTPSGFSAFAEKRPDWRDLLSTCDIQADPVVAEDCKKGRDAQNWEFVAKYCPADAKELAAEHCAGRDYTAEQLGPYAPLCRQYGRAKPDNAPLAPTKEELLKSGVNEGVNKLKKLLPF